MDLKNVWETASWLQCQGYIYRITTLAMILKRTCLETSYKIMESMHTRNKLLRYLGPPIFISYNDTMTA